MFLEELLSLRIVVATSSFVQQINKLLFLRAAASRVRASRETGLGNFRDEPRLAQRDVKD